MRITGDWRVILPPLPAAAEVLISPLIVVFPVPELSVIVPPALVLLGEAVKEYRVAVVMLPLAVERAIAPPFPEFEREYTNPVPALVLIEPFPPVTETVMFPPVPVP